MYLAAAIISRSRELNCSKVIFFCTLFCTARRAAAAAVLECSISRGGTHSSHSCRKMSQTNWSLMLEGFEDHIHEKAWKRRQ